MNLIIEKMKIHPAANLPCCGDSDTHTIPEMLYCCYHECSGTREDRFSEGIKVGIRLERELWE